ncbi:hypothetical protein JST97_14040 [bacterium]|nr:hypothetical protein [bacterium]
MSKSSLYWVSLVLCLRLIIWMNPEGPILHLYDPLLGLGILAWLWASNRNVAFLDL